MDPINLKHKGIAYVDINIPKKDKSLSFTIAVILHALIFVVVGISFIKPPQFGIDKGFGSIEVSLVAESAEVTPQAPVDTTPVQEKADVVQEAIVKPVIKQEASVKTEGKDQVTAQSNGGAISEAKPDYLKNPPPAYPESARRRGYEGTVLLQVLVDKHGFPTKVEIEQSSGHKTLDDAALKAVQKWQFQAARLGDLTVESTVRVPIKFDLRESR